jgi:aryl-alcohol dehydrogenase-like predicted oxidoreductase
VILVSTIDLSRRDFLRATGVAASAAALAACVVVPDSPPASGEGAGEPAYKIPRRALGKTGWRLSVVGFGGIVVMNEMPDDAKALVAKAIERDINYFDVAPSYGNAQERLGPALEPYRQDVFLACKTTQRTKSGTEAELKRSLALLRTDHFDVYQFHAVTTMADVETIFGPGGAMEAFKEAREKGQIRHIGFSAHSEAAALAMLDRFPFDTILYPVNWGCWHGGNFGPKVIAVAQEQGLGILALKSLARQQWPAGATKKWFKCWYQPVDTPEEVSLGLRFTLAKGATAAVSPSHAELLWMMCDAAEKFTPITPEEEAQLAAKSKEIRPIFTA